MNYDFRIRARVEAMTPGFELALQLREVVDLAVVDRPDAPVLVVNRLPAGVDVDHGQAPHGQADVAVEVNPVVVGTPMDERLAHRGEGVGLDAAMRLQVDLTGDPAHGSGRGPSGLRWHWACRGRDGGRGSRGTSGSGSAVAVRRDATTRRSWE